MAFILKKLAGADKLRNMKLAPAPNVNKANAVQRLGNVGGSNGHGRLEHVKPC
jgi:hypothetical protein